MQQPKTDELATARRNQILDAAARVFARKGFHPTTIKDIAKEAGIADGTVYIYFKSKTALLLGIFDRMTETAQRLNQDLPLATMDLEELVRAHLRHPLAAFKSDNFELFRVILSEVMVNEELRTLYYERVLAPTIALAEAPLQAWAAHNGVSPQRMTLLLHTISSMVLGLVMQRILGDPTLAARWDELPELLTDLLLNDIRSDLQ